MFYQNIKQAWSSGLWAGVTSWICFDYPYTGAIYLD